MAKREKSATADLGLRVKETLRLQIERAAAGTGHSMNAEIVRRLERSFDRQDLLTEILELAYGKQKAQVLLAVAGNEHKLFYAVNELIWQMQREGKSFKADLLPPPPTDEEFEDMKRRHETMVKR